MEHLIQLQWSGKLDGEREVTSLKPTNTDHCSHWKDSFNKAAHASCTPLNCFIKSWAKSYLSLRVVFSYGETGKTLGINLIRTMIQVEKRLQPISSVNVFCLFKTIGFPRTRKTSKTLSSLMLGYCPLCVLRCTALRPGESCHFGHIRRCMIITA